MNQGSDAAEQMVRMSLNGVEVVARLSGQGAKELAALIYSILKDTRKTKGKTRLETMLRSGKELKVIAVKEQDLEAFTKNAKGYGIMYTVIRGKHSNNRPDGLVDVMVRAEDASKVNRIFDRFKLSSVDVAALETKIEQNRGERNPNEIAQEDAQWQTPQTEKTEATPAQMNEKEMNELLDDLLAPVPPEKDEAPRNPDLAQSDQPQFERSSTKSNSQSVTATFEDTRMEPERPSVRKELEELAKKAKDPTAKSPEPVKTGAQHIAPPAKPPVGKER